MTSLVRSSTLLLVLAAAAAVAAGPGCDAAAGAPPTPSAELDQPVRLAPVVRARRARPVHATGLLASKAEVRASFKVGGIVSRLTVDEGDPVTAGQVLARLASAEIDAGVEQARQALTKASRDLARAERLLAGLAATREQADDAATGVAVAQAQLRAAEFNRAHAVIRAPGAGRVLRRLVEEGELVGPGQPALILSGDAAGWVVRVGLADRDVVRLHQGDQAQVTVPAWAGLSSPGPATLSAKVSELASAASPPVGTYEVELQLATAAAAGPLLSGLVAHVEIAPTATAEVALVPIGALRDGDGARATVWSVDAGGLARPHQVEVAFFAGDEVALVGGLPGVEQVVSVGAAYLRAGQPVAVIAAAPSPVPSSPSSSSAVEAGR